MDNIGLYMNYWKHMSDDKQVAFLLGISEVIFKSFESNEYYNDIRKALDTCWKWLETKEVSGEEIYFLLDDGTEYGGLFIKMQMDSEIEDESKWDCIIDTISYVSRLAFFNMKEEYLPEPIENIDDEIVIHFLECYETQSNRQINIKEFLDYLNKNDVITNKSIMNYFS